jgi:hypothetical protein
MKMKYQLCNNWRGETDGVMRFNDDGSITSFPSNPANTDYQAYLAWLAEGNEPLPADEPAQPE